MSYYYCLTHQTVEEGAGCRAADRMGPYDSAAAAANWRQTHEAREQVWEAGEDEDDDEK
jgi:hypothetical protein